MLSIVVPVYKTEKYIRQCIDSILAQEYDDFELILIDDGSPDSSGAVCDEYARQDKRIKVVHKENGGLRSAVRLGTKLATGEYLTFADSDDWLEPDMYKNMMDLIERYALDCVICNYKYFYEETGEYKSVDFGIAEGLYAEEDINKFYAKLLPGFADRRYVAGARWNKIFKKEKLAPVINAARDDVTVAEDTMVTHKALLECERVYFLNKDLYIYRRNIGSITTSSYKGKYLDDWYFATAIYDAYEEKLGKEKINEAKFIHLVIDVLGFIMRSNVSNKIKKKWLTAVCEDERVKDVLRSVSRNSMNKIDAEYYDLLKKKNIGMFLLKKSVRKAGGKILRKLKMIK